MDLKEFLQSKFDKTSFIQFISERFYGFEENINGDFLGKVRLDDRKELGFFVFQVGDDKDIENNRVGLNSELKKRAADSLLDSAIAAFYNNKQKAWRLSFIRFSYDDKNKQQVSNLKKFTFVLGTPTVNTAHNQLQELKYPNTKALEGAFGVEKVSNEFFAKYRSLFEKLNYNLSSQMALFGNEEAMRAFSKKLLGRIVFLYFLQKKGWLGVPKNGLWGEGDKGFLSALYKADSGDFYVKKLSPLFFDTLNQQRPNDYSDIFDCRIPFLNGGLFDKNIAYDDRVFISDEIFGEIFDTFDGYNFTIIEDSAEESEVAIDPEMLGRVFENLLEENYRKGKGAFYTPREIVGYMCKNSIEHYLDDVTRERQYLFGVDEFLKCTAMSDEEICGFYKKHPQKYIVVENYFEKIEPYKNLVVNFRIVAKLRGFIKDNDRLAKSESYGGHSEISFNIWQKILKKEYIYHSHIVGSNKEIKIQNKIFIYPTIIKYIQIDESFFALALLPNVHGDLELNTIFPVRKRGINSKTSRQQEIYESWDGADFAFGIKVLEELKSLWRDCHSPHTVPHKSGEHNTASRFSMISHKLFRVENLAEQTLKKHLGLKWYDLKVNKILNNSTIPQTDLTDTMLKHIKTIKVLDPAIGSGAFPMGVLHEIVQTRVQLGDKTPYAKLKREIIENSIYGVDIDSDAVEIAKLRFWLSLTVDEESPSPLPNLDFKIMQGNSLLETINGFSPIPQDIYEQTKPQSTTLFGDVERTLFDEKLFDKLTNKIHEFYRDTIGTQKQSDKDEIKSIVKQIIDSHIKKEEETYRQNEEWLQIGQSPEKKKKINNMACALENINKAEIVLIELLKNNFQTKELFLYKLFFGEVLKEGGFDIVIGNPPYIRQEKIKELKPKLQIEGYKSFNGTADIYIYFFEQGYRLLRENGVLSFITSNKYSRAKYGKEFREFVLSNAEILEYIDFNGVKVFESATVDTSIFSFKKTKKSSDFIYCDIGANYKGEELKGYCEKYGFSYSQSDLSAESFTFASPKELKVKKRIEEIGTPLKEWDVKIYRGVLTGFNEAFIIDSQKREELIAKDPKSAEIIKPILRGRDIKRYSYEWAGYWLINSHNNPPVNMDDYPVIKEHLDGYYPQLLKRTDQGSTPYNLRNCAYLDDFEKEKIVYLELVDKATFCFDSMKHFALNTTYMMIGKSIRYLVSVLNSKVNEWYFDTICAESGTGTNRWIKQYVELLPIAKISELAQKPFEILVDYIIYAKSVGLETEAKFFESVIDVMVCGLYFEESMKKADCYINDEVGLLLENHIDIKEAYKTFKENKTIMRGLTYSRTVEEVKIINGAKND